MLKIKNNHNFITVMDIIDLTSQYGDECENPCINENVPEGYNGPDLIMGIDIGPRNTGICIFSALRRKVVWWVWVDLQGYFPVYKIRDIVGRLSAFAKDYKHVFDACDVICVEGQTEVQTQRGNMYLQNAFQALFPYKVTIQNSRSMGTLMRKLAPKSFVDDLKKKGKTERRIKKLCTVWVGRTIAKNSVIIRSLHAKILRDRKSHQRFLKSNQGKLKRKRLEELDDQRLRSQGIGNKKAKNKRIKWTHNLSKEDFDIWDALIIAYLEASRRTKRDIIVEELNKSLSM